MTAAPKTRAEYLSRIDYLLDGVVEACNAHRIDQTSLQAITIREIRHLITDVVGGLWDRAGKGSGDE